MAQRAGMAQWKAGADTCVFKPAVRCAGESNRRPGVSRIRTKEAGARDLAVEERIRTAFPDLVSSGAVVVYSKACSPVYDAEDMKSDVPGEEACAALGVRKGPADHLNLITPKMDGTILDYLEAHPEANRREVLQPAALTAVAMVPDAGPWIVHMDLHPGNVLYKRGAVALADWGRTLIIENPADLESVRKGIREWMAGYGGSVDETADVLVANLAMLDWPVAKHMGALLTDPVEGMEEHLAAIRGWAVYVLLGSSDPALLTATSQAELRSRLAVRGGFSMKSRSMRKTRRGGARWREGADTCVFKPAVRCIGEPERRAGVSRIVNANMINGNVELEAQRMIAALGIPGVVVYSHTCSPAYNADDVVNDPTFQPKDRGGCSGLYPAPRAGPQLAHLNMITDEWSETLGDYLNPGVELVEESRKADWRNVIPYALAAAVLLVPDAGPWIIHTDCHFDNIMVRYGAGGIESGLSDWGRALIIRNLAAPGDEIRDWVVNIGIFTAVDSWGRPVRLQRGESYAVVADAIESYVFVRREYPQMPRIILRQLALFLRNPVRELNATLRALRGWVPYVIIKQISMELDTIREDFYPAGSAAGTRLDPAGLLRCESYDALADMVSKFLMSFPVVDSYDDVITRFPGISFVAAHDWWSARRARRRLIADGKDPGDLPDPVAPPPVAVMGPPPAGGAYWPAKYFKGLTRRQNAQRKRSATRRTKMSSKDPKAYVPFKSDKGQKTRKSSYTERFHKKYPGVTSLPDIAKATGVSKSVLEKVYDRGMAAWRTGHRPGASQQAWGMARVYSFVLHGKTYRTADKDLATTG